MNKNSNQIRNNLFYIGIAAAIVSMLFSNFSKMFSFITAVIAIVAIVIGLFLMFVGFIKNKNQLKKE